MADDPSAPSGDRTVAKLLRQQAALAAFGTFAFRENDLLKILNEGARICASSLQVPFCKVCRYRPLQGDLLIEAGCGWNAGVVGRVVSQADESSPQGRAYVTGQPVIICNLAEANNLNLPAFYLEHGIISTVDVVIPGFEGAPYGVLEIDSPSQHQYDVHDINFLTGFANVLAEAVATATRVAALTALVEEKNLLAEELQHRARNNLHMLTGMLERYARSAADEEARKGVELIVRRVTTLAQVYDSLLGVGLSAKVDLAHYLRELCLTLPNLQDHDSERVQLVCAAESLPVSVDVVTGIGMVIAELVSNSYGHAFPTGVGRITVTLSRSLSEGSAALTVQDDGVGFVVTAETNRRGISLVRRLMERMGGTLGVQSGRGTLWTMKFPLPSEEDGLPVVA